MANELLKQEQAQVIQAISRPMTVQEVKEQVNIIQQVLMAVMKDGEHYGVVPGCGKKKVLLKPGAEKILSTFRIGTELSIEDLSDGYDFRYRVVCRGFYIPTGNTIGYGAGEASTGEKKYKWRAAICHEEFDAMPETKRQIVYLKDFKTGKIELYEQVRQSPADLANTVLKMAKKRALVDAALLVGSLSDIFHQDLEDIDLSGQQTGGKKYYTDQDGTISKAQAKRMFAISKGNADIIRQVLQEYGYERSEEVKKTEYDAICSKVEELVTQ